MESVAISAVSMRLGWVTGSWCPFHLPADVLAAATLDVTAWRVLDVRCNGECDTVVPRLCFGKEKGGKWPAAASVALTGGKVVVYLHDKSFDSRNDILSGGGG